MRDKIFVDTNILVYLSNEDSSFHVEVNKKFIEISAQYELWISRQVLREYAVVMSSLAIIEKPLTAEEVVQDIEKWGKIFKIADETSEVTEILKKLIKEYDLKGKRIHDANIVATMLANSINKLYTLNIDDFKKFKGIELSHFRN
jgi:predicted nucleic acid-binding protein